MVGSSWGRYDFADVEDDPFGCHLGGFVGEALELGALGHTQHAPQQLTAHEAAHTHITHDGSERSPECATEEKCGSEEGL